MTRSVADLHDLELIWPSLGPTDVIATGTFDQWSSSIRLAKGDTGFSSTVKVPWGQKVMYKFIVDGRWRCRDDLPQEDDGHGNINNVLRTPEKPQLFALHDLPTRLSIPLNGSQNEGYGDLETMVTAVEFLPPGEPAAIRGPFPLPIPQITVEGLAQSPSTGTPVCESKLNTAAATEGHVSPTSETSTNRAPLKQAPSSCDASMPPISDHGSTPLPLVNGNGELHDSSSVPETVMQALFAPLESALPQLSQSSPQAVQDILALTDHVDVPPASIPAAIIEATTKQPQVDLVEPAARGRRQTVSPASITRASTPSTPASSALIPKKRRSLFARIKHIFDKDGDKQERKNKP